MVTDTASRPGPIRRLLGGAWSAVNFTRRLIINLVFFGVLFFFLLMFVAALVHDAGLEPVQDDTALVLDLNGVLVEQFTTDPLTRAIDQATGSDQPQELQLRDLLAALDAAKGDPKITQLVLYTDGFMASGMAGVRELGAAIAAFRASGKRVVAFGTGFEQMGYYLAAQADEIVMDPEGLVLIEGLGRYRLYFRELLADKLGVDVHLFRVGEYKSAAEPYIRDDASPEAKEADLFWMGDLWQRYLAEVAQARDLPVADFDALLRDLPARLRSAGGDFAQLALDSKLIDATATSEEFDARVAEAGAEDEETGYRMVDLGAYLAHARRGERMFDGDRVAVVVAQGEIIDGEQPPGVVGGDSTSALLRNARDDEAVKAVVLRVDSPGGAVFPSEQIRREVALLQEAGKPVVVSMGDVAASGGYWISMNADRIFADPSTITGSIGIYGIWLSAPRALEQIGMRADGVGTAPLAGAFDPTRPLQPDVGTLIQAFIDHGYAQFIGKVAAARGMEVDAVDAVARGRVWSGVQAKERGLVDELGGLAPAIEHAATLAKLKEGNYRVRYVEEDLTPFQQMLADLGVQSRGRVLLQAAAPALALLGPAQARQAQADLQFLLRANGKPFQSMAHCLCGL